MVIEKGKIVECTDEELYKYWLQVWSNILPYNEYKERCKGIGMKVIENTKKINKRK